MKDSSPLVSVLCLVYNHELYLRQCIEGFVMQKTNFNFEVIIHDDFSTDNSATIIREYANKYPNILKPIYEIENQYSKKDDSLANIVNAAIHPKTKYIALCEGDDYWIDPHKLQKQVDILENDASCSIVYSRVMCYNQLLGKIVAIFGKERKDLKDRLLHECFIATCSCCFKKCDYDQYIQEIKPSSHNWLMGDIPLFLYLGTKGYGKMLRECTSVYRILQSSASHCASIDLQLLRIQNTIDIYRFFADKYYPNNNRILSKIKGGYLYRIYLLYKKNKLPIPYGYKKEIYNYRGTHFKIQLVKLFLMSPLFEKIIRKIINVRMSLVIFFEKK